MTGVSLRGSVYWLRRRVNGRMEQFSLETSDEAEAIQKARLHIAEGSRRIRTAELSCDAARERYLARLSFEGVDIERAWR